MIGREKGKHDGGSTMVMTMMTGFFLMLGMGYGVEGIRGWEEFWILFFLSAEEKKNLWMEGTQMNEMHSTRRRDYI